MGIGGLTRAVTVSLILMACLSMPLQAASPGTWTDTGNLYPARARHTATLLPDGRVLVAGGLTGTLTNSAPTTDAQLYEPAKGENPAKGKWSVTGNLITPRSRHTATLLPNGNVLVVGGRGMDGLAIASAELYNPATGEWSSTGSLNIPRDSHTATLLLNGKVLVAGGLSLGDGAGNPVEKSAEVYDPLQQVWLLVDPMVNARYGHSAVSLPNGTVLVAGGSGPRTDGVYWTSAEVYDVQANKWLPLPPMATPRGFHVAGALNDGSVLVAGGFTMPANGLNLSTSTEKYQPATGSWIGVGNLNVARAAGPFGATSLADGRLLVAGGRTPTAELYTPVTGVWTQTGSMAVSRSRHTLTLLPDGRVLAVGGENQAGFIGAAEVYTP